MTKAAYFGFHSLTPPELWALRGELKTAVANAIRSAPHSAVRCASACLNEVDAELERRGLLDPKTGVAPEPRPA